MVSHERLQVGGFEVDLRAGELRKHGRRIKLQPQPFEILSILLEHPGEVVLRDQLRQRLWPNDVFVDFEHSLNRSINKLRAAFGDSVERPRFIETLSGRGYRFIARVDNCGNAACSKARRIAILPVENITGNPENDYLADGLTEALIERIGRSLSERVRVIALASVLRFKKLALPVSQVAAELGVDLALAGRLRRVCDDLSVRLELIDPTDQTSVWSGSFVLDRKSQWSFCDDVSAAVASALEVEAPATVPKTATRESGFIEAQQAYLRGRYFWNQRTKENVTRALEYFRWATEKDPSYPLPYVGLAESYIVLTSWGLLHPKEAISFARDAALKALAIDPDLAEAHVALGWSRLVLDWDWPSAEQEFQTAITLNPSNPTAYHWYSYFLAARGSVAESLDVNRRGLQIDPLSVALNSVRGWLLYCAGRYEEAAAQCRRTYEIECSQPQPRFYLALACQQLGQRKESVSQAQQAVSLSNNVPTTRMLLANCYAAAGFRAEAIDLLSELEKLADRNYLCGYFMGAAYAALGMLDEAFGWLEKSCEDREVWTLFLSVDPQFSPLRSDDRFRAVLRQLPTTKNSSSSAA